MLSIASCGDDDVETPTVCMQSDWVGVYEGTEACSVGPSQEVVLTITASGTDAINLSYVTEDGTTFSFTDPIVFDGCRFNVSGTDPDISLSANATLSDATLTLNTTLTIGSDSNDCTVTVTRN